MTKVEIDWYENEFPAINRLTKAELDEDLSGVYDVSEDLIRQYKIIEEKLRKVLVKIEKQVNDQAAERMAKNSYRGQFVFMGSIADNYEIKFEE